MPRSAKTQAGSKAERRKHKSEQRATDLLELLDGTLVDATALVDQVCRRERVSAEAVEQATPHAGKKTQRLRPVVVDFPESTWPMTTTLMCVFSDLLSSVSTQKRHGGEAAPPR